MSVMRSVLLAASESRFLRERATKLGFVRAAVTRFMPGEDAQSALDAARALGEGAVLTHLGENLENAKAAEEVTKHYLDVLDLVKKTGLDVEISVKPTQLGLDFSKEECERHLHALIERARSLNNWVWIDMESTAYTDVTLEIYRRARERFPNTGLCVQAYLYRTAEGSEAPDRARLGRAPGQGRLQGARRQGLPEEERRRRELLQARRRCSCPPRPARRACARSSARTTRS